MKNGIMTVFRKELARFFGDKRMVITTILLPGLMIYLMYSFMGNALSSMYGVDEEQVLTVCSVNTPDSVRSLAESSGIELSETFEGGELTPQLVADGAIDLLAVFPEGFDSAVAAYDAASGKAAPNVQVYYNSTSTGSYAAYNAFTAMLNGYESSMANKFDINGDADGGTVNYDMATSEDTTSTIFSSMLPMLLLIFMFSGCMAVAPESIAGEKERGTIATMLITPIKRSEIAVGKILALALIALLAGASSTLGTILSLPKLMGAAADGLSGNIYGVTDYALLAVVILSTVLLMITLISIISAFAKTVKEAQMIVTPLMVVIVLVGVTAMFGGGAKTELYYYLIPVYNSVQCMVGIFSLSLTTQSVIVAVVSNLIYSALGVFVLTRMFNSEKIIFAR